MVQKAADIETLRLVVKQRKNAQSLVTQMNELRKLEQQARIPQDIRRCRAIWLGLKKILEESPANNGILYVELQMYLRTAISRSQPLAREELATVMASIETRLKKVMKAEQAEARKRQREEERARRPLTGHK